MTEYALYVGYALVAYLIGSIPCGYLIGRVFYDINLKEIGSGNIGATNAYRELGLKAGVSVFVCDFLKGVIAVSMGGGSLAATLLCALFVVIGNNWSVFLRFKSGKGVACGVGAFTCICPQAILAGFLVWLVVFRLKKIVSLASLLSAPVVPMVMWVIGEPLPIVVFAFLATSMVIGRHHENIKRLLRGEEKPISREEH